MAAIYEEAYPAHEAIPRNGASAPTLPPGIVEALGRALELHDYRRGTFGETAAHTARVTRMAMELAERVAPGLAADPQLAAGFRLHDIGMIGIPVQVLAKQGPLSADEVNEIHEHPWLGERIVAPLDCLNGVARQVIACHHERWDGSGYPRGLRGVEIPLAARIFSVVDAFDSMTSAQPHRQAQSEASALAELEEKSGSHFDPAIVAAFLALHDEHHAAPAAEQAYPVAHTETTEQTEIPEHEHQGARSLEVVEPPAEQVESYDGLVERRILAERYGSLADGQSQPA